jgi:hypothetical protein
MTFVEVLQFTFSSKFYKLDFGASLC